MIKLQIRRKNAKVWQHFITDGENFILSKCYCKTNGDKFRVVEDGGTAKNEYNFDEIEIYDDLNAGSAETFTSSLLLMERLSVLQYVGFNKDGDVVIADLISSDSSNALIEGTDGKLFVSTSGGGGSNKQTFQYNTTSLCLFNFPATSNWTRQGGFFGMGAYGSARSDSGVGDFMTLIASGSYGTLIGGIAPFDMKLTSNQSFVSQNNNLVGGNLKIAIGYIDLNYVTGVRSNATLVDEGTYTPESNGLVDLREDFEKEITIPKGALWLYSWAHTKTSAVSSVYIQTILNFEEA